MRSHHKILDRRAADRAALYPLTLSFLLANASTLAAQGFQPEGPYKSVLARLQAMTASPLADWRAHAANLPHPKDLIPL